jgi:hypothetical protein
VSADRSAELVFTSPGRRGEVGSRSKPLVRHNDPTPSPHLSPRCGEREENAARTAPNNVRAAGPFALDLRGGIVRNPACSGQSPRGGEGPLGQIA